jgi:MoxR-like ATPase
MTQSKPDYNALPEAVKDRATFSQTDWLNYVKGGLITDFNRNLLGNHEEQKGVRDKIRDALDQQEFKDRLTNLRVWLKTLFTEKEEIVDPMIYSTIAQEPMLLFGEPGTAKTALVKRLAEALGLKRFDPQDASRQTDFYYEYLLTSFTEPDELLGPVIIKDLVKEQPEFVRYQQGMMPMAGLVFLDEIFRANSAILNTLLSLINERIVYEAGGVKKAETLMVFGAANLVPVSPELYAFYERFPIRVRSLPVSDENRADLFWKGWALEKTSRNGNIVMEKTIEDIALPCLTDMVLCNTAILLEALGEPEDSFIQLYSQTVKLLNRDTRGLCSIDDRKFIKLYKVMCARALVERLERPSWKDLVILKHTWRDFDVIESLDDHINHLLSRFRDD